MNNVKFVLFSAGIMLALAFTFSCSSDDDGGGNDIKSYKTVKIGNQVWMAENLNYNVKGSKCYDNKESNCDKYGRLYSWATAMGIDAKYNNEVWDGSDVKHRGICPSGWHIPSHNDWSELKSYVESDNGCKNCAGKYLKAKSGWIAGGNGEDKYSFSALPSSYGDSSGYFKGIGNYSDWW